MIFGCVTFPGSGLYDWCKSKGLIKDDKDFYDRYINQHWSLDQIPVNMTDLSNDEANKAFAGAKKELTEFFEEKIADGWLKFFGGDVEGMQRTKDEGKKVDPIRFRLEATSSTFDTSGRT